MSPKREILCLVIHHRTIAYYASRISHSLLISTTYATFCVSLVRTRGPTVSALTIRGIQSFVSTNLIYLLRRTKKKFIQKTVRGAGWLLYLSVSRRIIAAAGPSSCRTSAW